jgi:hypothetical protein
MMIIGILLTYRLFRLPTTTVLSENSIHHFWDGDSDGDGTDGRMDVLSLSHARARAHTHTHTHTMQENSCREVLLKVPK